VIKKDFGFIMMIILMNYITLEHAKIIDSSVPLTTFSVPIRITLPYIIIALLHQGQLFFRLRLILIFLLIGPWTLIFNPELYASNKNRCKRIQSVTQLIEGLGWEPLETLRLHTRPKLPENSRQMCFKVTLYWRRITYPGPKKATKLERCVAEN
jgi:hypothetical protein